ncbi:MAG: hypothetical protein PUD20_08055, partial [bacterium]|nr:hypothetical protein [bacterium]
MAKTCKKLLAVLCLFALVVTALPISAKAAAKPKFTKTYASLYENGTGKGKYTFKLQNLTKGQRVEWSVSGAGKSYVSLKKTKTTVTGTTVSNVVTVKTNGKTAAKNKKIALTAKVYSKAGKLQYTVTTKSTIKIKTTKIAIKAPAAAKDNLEVGKSYRFGYTVTPANSTAKNVWTVTDSNGLDCSSYMSSTGIFKPALPGVYTIKIQSMIDSKVIKSASVKVEVVDYLISVKQPAANQLLLTYSGNVSEVFSKD